MKNKYVYILLMFISLFMVVGCKDNNGNNSNKDVEIKENDTGEVTNMVKAIIEGEEYIINLEDNETAKSFVKMLPKKYNMSELNDNEKYVYLDNSLLTNAFNPKHIEAGDVMLFGNNCLVIFYKSFDTPYSYTKIGHIDNLGDLGNDDIEVEFVI